MSDPKDDFSPTFARRGSFLGTRNEPPDAAIAGASMIAYYMGLLVVRGVGLKSEN
ncbi:MAG: hypothetical protein VCD33_00490 [Alphaproteobacteria bacterium]